ncbi:MAG: hypothetical protein IT538_11640 [Variibacter sp.]|nr:hypothetical protein [Variibacter sp.]
MLGREAIGWIGAFFLTAAASGACAQTPAPSPAAPPQAAAAQAQAPSGPQPDATGKCGIGRKSYDAKELLTATLNLPGGHSPRPAVLLATARTRVGTRVATKTETAPDEVRALAGSTISVTLLASAIQPKPRGWVSVYTIGAAETDRKVDVERPAAASQSAAGGTVVDQPSKRPVQQVPIGVYLTDRADDRLVVDVTLPEQNPEGFGLERWRVVAVVCDGETSALLGYATVTVHMISNSLAWSISLLALALFWTAISIAAGTLNKQKLEVLWRRYYIGERDDAPNPTPAKELLAAEIGSSEPLAKLSKLLWKACRALNPVFISQDSLGYGSLSRFQILVFTTTVGLVLFHIFVQSGVISTMSNMILLLLGITVAGGTFARITSDWAKISPATRRVLIGTEALKIRTNKPRFSDMLETEGELDVTKAQALLFTGLVAAAILVSGVNVGLAGFELPEQVVYLTLISQVAYVGGKLMPTDTRRRVEGDMLTLREAARKLIDKPTPEADEAFKQALAAASSTLNETYLQRFNAEVFNKLKPEQVV